MGAEFAAIIISVVSLGLSGWLAVRERTNRKLDLLHQCYDRIHRAHSDRPLATETQLMAMDADPGHPDHEEYAAKSRRAQTAVDRELEFACYLVTQGEVDLERFFDLFHGFLAGRALGWRQPPRQYHAGNHAYTVQVILDCEARGLLPVGANQGRQVMNRATARFLDGAGVRPNIERRASD
jgi:hypothetical protein